MVDVPDVYLKSQAEATAILEGLGFKVKANLILGAPLDKVTGQTPPADSKPRRAAPSRSPWSEQMPEHTPPRAATLATLLLLAVTAAWGSTFFLIRDLVTTIHRRTSSSCASPSPRRR